MGNQGLKGNDIKYDNLNFNEKIIQNLNDTKLYFDKLVSPKSFAMPDEKDAYIDIQSENYLINTLNYEINGKHVIFIGEAHDIRYLENRTYWSYKLLKYLYDHSTSANYKNTAVISETYSSELVAFWTARLCINYGIKVNHGFVKSHITNNFKNYFMIDKYDQYDYHLLTSTQKLLYYFGLQHIEEADNIRKMLSMQHMNIQITLDAKANPNNFIKNFTNKLFETINNICNNIILASNKTILSPVRIESYEESTFITQEISDQIHDLILYLLFWDGKKYEFTNMIKASSAIIKSFFENNTKDNGSSIIEICENANNKLVNNEKLRKQPYYHNFMNTLKTMFILYIYEKKTPVNEYENLYSAFVDRYNISTLICYFYIRNICINMSYMHIKHNPNKLFELNIDEIDQQIWHGRESMWLFENTKLYVNLCDIEMYGHLIYHLYANDNVNNIVLYCGNYHVQCLYIYLMQANISDSDRMIWKTYDNSTVKYMHYVDYDFYSFFLGYDNSYRLSSIYCFIGEIFNQSYLDTLTQLSNIQTINPTASYSNNDLGERTIKNEFMTHKKGRTVSLTGNIMTKFEAVALIIFLINNNEYKTEEAIRYVNNSDVLKREKNYVLNLFDKDVNLNKLQQLIPFKNDAIETQVRVGEAIHKKMSNTTYYSEDNSGKTIEWSDDINANIDQAHVDRCSEENNKIAEMENMLNNMDINDINEKRNELEQIDAQIDMLRNTDNSELLEELDNKYDDIDKVVKNYDKLKEKINNMKHNLKLCDDSKKIRENPVGMLSQRITSFIYAPEDFTKNSTINSAVIANGRNAVDRENVLYKTIELFQHIAPKRIVFDKVKSIIVSNYYKQTFEPYSPEEIQRLCDEYNKGGYSYYGFLTMIFLGYPNGESFIKEVKSIFGFKATVMNILKCDDKVKIIDHILNLNEKIFYLEKNAQILGGDTTTHDTISHAPDDMPNMIPLLHIIVMCFLVILIIVIIYYIVSNCVAQRNDNNGYFDYMYYNDPYILN
jgi:hypothetical protein